MDPKKTEAGAPAADEDESSLVPIIKATIIGRDGTEQSNVVQTPDYSLNLFKNAGALPPPYDPRSLADLYEMSGALRSNVDAYATNIDRFGHSFEPVFDVDDDQAIDKVKHALIELRLAEFERDAAEQGEQGEEGSDEADPSSVLDTEVSDQEAEAKLEEIRKAMVREKMLLECFFDAVTVEESFTSLRARTRVDEEVIGNGYWEVLRNRANEIVQFVYMPAHTVRLMPVDDDPIEVQMHVRRSVLDVTTETVQRRFRRFVQVLAEQRLIWFKEFGDPRTYSSKSGKPYKDVRDLEKHEPNVRPATEVLHWRIHNPRSPYGIPRWISELTSVLGTRHAQEVNLMYFENRSIPPMAILVSGGRLNKDSVTKLKTYIENEIKGKRNWHKIMILEAESSTRGGPTTNNGRVRVEIKPLNSVQTSDAQFLNYIEKNTDSIGMVFRLPRLLRGDARDFNRATAQTSLEFTEQQVFGPLRKEFDFVINRTILSELGVRYWKFRSRGPDFSDPLDQVKAIAELAKGNFLTPAELRELSEKPFNTNFKKIEEPWAEQPIAFTLAGIQVDGFEDGTLEGGSEDVFQAQSGRLARQAHQLIKLRDMFQQRAHQLARREYFELQGGLTAVSSKDDDE